MGKYYLLVDSRGVGHPCNEETLRKLLATGKKSAKTVNRLIYKTMAVGPLTSEQFQSLVEKFLKPVNSDTPAAVTVTPQDSVQKGVTTTTRVF